MPQMTKGGKFIFGKSLIRDDLTIQLPPQAITEYNIVADGKVYCLPLYRKQSHRRLLCHQKRITAAFQIRPYSY